MKWCRIKLFFICGIFLLTGCARTYNQQITPVKNSIQSEDFEGAVSSIEDTKIGEQYRNRLLYHLEAGLLYHLAGDYHQSNYFLERAEWISDEMYTRSISAEAASMLTSDLSLPYRGEYYDYLFTNYYKLLNYLYLGQLESALVEVRRINHKHTLFDETKAFLHYLAAVLYQVNGQNNEAFIEYQKALRAYREKYPEQYGLNMPRSLARDISVFCLETRFPRCNEFPGDVKGVYTPPESYGQVIFITETNFIPHKEERTIEAAIPQNLREKHSHILGNQYYIKVAMPEYTSFDNTAESARLNINGQYFNMDLVEDLGRVAKEHFDREKSKIMARAVVRAVSKYVSYRAVKGSREEDEENDEDAGRLREILATVVNIFGTATERADTRSWLTLPNRIFFSRQYLKPGDYTFRVEIKTGKGRFRTVDKNLTVEEGEVKFISLRKFN